jgi:ribosome maturation factor RimP
MVQKERIRKLVEDNLSERMFLVDIKVSKSNVINVFVDGIDGITIEQCVVLSRLIESNFDREAEDFELEVSSAGLGQPFKVIQQYYKNVGKEVEIVANDGVKRKGVLKNVSDDGVTLISESLKKAEGSKKKHIVTEELKYMFKDIKSVIEVITF